MTVKTISIYVLILVALPWYGWSTDTLCNTADCKELLLAYLDKMEAINTPEKGEVYHVKYQMKTVFNESLGVDSEIANTEVFTTANKIALYDKNMSVFGDEENVFVVLPEHKKIYWNNSDPRIFNDANRYKKFLEIQRNLLNSAKTISCVDNDEEVLITVIPHDEFSKKTKLSHQKITYSTKEKRIVKVENLYSTTSKIKNQTITYLVLDFNSTINIDAPTTVLFSGNQLKSRYKGFEIIDNRQN
jgi:hypothetical protein